jgi:nuclear transport factor 2 (NTF2) superfamily protein
VAAGTLATVLDAFARRELDGVAAAFAEDGAYREARKPAIQGRSAIAAEFARYAASGRPYRFEVDDVIADTYRACVVYRFATPGGDGEPWRERAGCATIRFDERGQIAEWREYEG